MYGFQTLGLIQLYIYLDLLRSFMYKFDVSSVRDCICIFFFNQMTT